MKIKLLAGLLLAGAIPFVFNSCKDDDEVPKAGISFEKVDEETFESDATLLSFHPDLPFAGKGHEIVVKILLSRPVEETVVLKYSVTGTASMVNPPETYLVNDFTIKEGTNTIIGTDKITIEKGATEANIKLTVFEDLIFFMAHGPDLGDAEKETVVLKLESIESGPGILDANTTYTLSIKEDDSLLALYWNDTDTELVGDIDMDLFLWNDDAVFDASNSKNAENPEDSYEAIVLYGGYPESEYGVSYNYYSGTSDKVSFYAVMAGNINGEYFSGTEGDVLVHEGYYTLANINAYDETEVAPAIVQTLVKAQYNYQASTMTPPTTGSRSAYPQLTRETKVPLKLLEQIKKQQMTSFPGNRKISSIRKTTLTK